MYLLQARLIVTSDLDKYLCQIYCCRYGQFTWEDHRPRTGAWKGTRGGQAYSFSGCDDNQTSADTSVLFTPKQCVLLPCFISYVYKTVGVLERGQMPTELELVLVLIGSMYISLTPLSFLA